LDGISVVRFLKPECEKYKDVLSRLYFDNVRTCDYTESFSESDSARKIAEMTGYVEKDHAIVFGCITNTGNLAGFIWAYRHAFRDEERMYVSVVQVSKEFRNLGLGSKLLEAVEQEARCLGLPAIFIHTEAHNKGAIRLYEREGYVLERVQMRKQLSESQ